jgi:hypothetical protein
MVLGFLGLILAGIALALALASVLGVLRFRLG